MKIYGSISELVSSIYRKDSQSVTLKPSTAVTYTAARTVELPPQDAASVLVSANSTQTLTNKTISGASNTLSNVSLTSQVTGTLPAANGGTGVANSSTLTLGANNTTLTTSGVTSVTLPTSGTLATLAGAEILTNKSISGSTSTLTNISLTTAVTGTLPIANGGTAATTKTDAFDSLSPTTTKGDLIVSNGSDNIRLGVGADGTVLTAASGQASGLQWTTPLTNPMDSQGDLIIGGAAGAATKLDLGTADFVVKANTAGTNTVFGQIVDASVSATAAIAGTKISPAFGSQNISATGTLTLTGSPTFNTTLGTLTDTTTSGTTELRVLSNNTTGTSKLSLGTSGTPAAGYMQYNVAAASMTWGVNGGTNQLTLSSTGNLSIGLVSNLGAVVIGNSTMRYNEASDELYFGVDGQAATGISSSTLALTTGGEVYMPFINNASTANSLFYDTSTGHVTYASSSIVDKENVRALEIDSEVIYDLEEHTYERKSNGATEIGLIAEEVELVEPRLVGYNTLGVPTGVYYQWLCILQNRELRKLRDRVDALEAI